MSSCQYKGREMRARRGGERNGPGTRAPLLFVHHIVVAILDQANPKSKLSFQSASCLSAVFVCQESKRRRTHWDINHSLSLLTIKRASSSMSNALATLVK